MLAIVIGSVALAGVFTVLMQTMEVSRLMATMQKSIDQTQQDSALMSSQIKRLTSVRPQSEPISFSAETLSVTVAKDSLPTDIRATDLKKMADACNVKKPADYFGKLAQSFAGTNRIIYTFKYDHSASYTGGSAVLVPNKPKYKDLAAARGDFASCGSNSWLPVGVNKDWILFLMPCGPATDQPKSEAYQEACNEITKALATVKLR